MNENDYRMVNTVQEIREYIGQCWAEALYLFKKNELTPYADKSVLSVIRQHLPAGGAVHRR